VAEYGDETVRPSVRQSVRVILCYCVLVNIIWWLLTL